jgi:hypothetical protein
MGFTITSTDTRAAQITGGGMTFGDFWGVDASAANGAQPVAQFFDREGTSVLRLIRGTSGTTNIVATNVDAEDCFISVAANQTSLTSAVAVVV